MFKYPLKNSEIYHSFIISSENNNTKQQQNQLSPSPLPPSTSLVEGDDNGDNDDEPTQSKLSVKDIKPMKSKSNSHYRKKKEIIKPLSKQKSSQQKNKIIKQNKSLKTTLSGKNKQEKASHKFLKSTCGQKQIKTKEEKQKKKISTVKEKQNNSRPIKIHSASKTLESFSRQFLPAYSSAGKERQRKQEEKQEK